jgi:hypothetical protein
VKALQGLHAQAVPVTREGLWTQLYIRRVDPTEAARLAEREYWSTRPPEWIKRKG